MAELSITASSVRAGSNATKGIATAAVPLAAGNVIYLDGGDLDDDGAPMAKLADANSTKPLAAAVGICLQDCAAGQPIQYASEAENFVPGAILVPGQPYILSNTPGKICTAGDLASGWYHTALFIAKDTLTAVLAVNPSGLLR